MIIIMMGAQGTGKGTVAGLISQKTGMNAKSMTVLEFYNTLSNLQKQAEAEKKVYKQNKKT